MKGRVPDYVLGMADQLVNVDLSAEDLPRAVAGRQGHPPGGRRRRLENFFTGQT